MNLAKAATRFSKYNCIVKHSIFDIILHSFLIIGHVFIQFNVFVFDSQTNYAQLNLQIFSLLIQFSFFPNCYSCEISDSLTAYIITNGQKEWIDDFCGNELPPRIMSNGHRLTLEFKSLNHDEDHRPYVRFDKKIKYPTPDQYSPNNIKNLLELNNYQGDEGNTKYLARKLKKSNRNSNNKLDDEDDYIGGKNINLNFKPSDNLKKSTSSATIDLLGRSVNLYRHKGFKATFQFVTSKFFVIIFYK